MTDRPRGGLAALCIAQTTRSGLLYYSLPVAVTPISEDTGWSHTTITAAFSLGLIVSAVAGLRVGKILDHQGPRQVMTFAAIAGVLDLALVAWSPNPLMFFLAWLVAGFGQSAVLYPPALVVITRWYGSRRVGVVESSRWRRSKMPDQTKIEVLFLRLSGCAAYRSAGPCSYPSIR